MSRAERFVELWNEGRVRDALGATAPGYTYSDSVLGGPHDAKAHIALMESIFESMPDRRITIDRLWVTDDAEFLDYTWRRTDPAAGTFEATYFAVLEFDRDGSALRQRHFAT